MVCKPLAWSQAWQVGPAMQSMRDFLAYFHQKIEHRLTSGFGFILRFHVNCAIVRKRESFKCFRPLTDFALPV